MLYVSFGTEQSPLLPEKYFQNNEVMITDYYDDIKILNFLFNIFTFLIVLIKQV